MTPSVANFLANGFSVFGPDPALQAWVEASLGAARASVVQPDNAMWMRYQGTWFVGVSALPNDEHGLVAGGPPLQGRVVDFLRMELCLGEFSWDRAQVSVCYPGYPARGEGESESLHRYRLSRDAAHVDGLRREGPGRRRFLREHHGFILGIPMVHFSAGAAPLVVWRKSHEVMRAAFEERLFGIEVANWPDQDLTDVYQAARERVFSTCERVEMYARPGEAFLVHRLALHGMAPWAEGATASDDGRMVVYFRPETGGARQWLRAP